jgi:peptidoglycan/xylan/chitin deacetylase (PgdA/CDA1 family)
MCERVNWIVSSHAQSEIAMSGARVRLLAVAAASLCALFGMLSAAPSQATPQPPPGSEGPAGPPALMPNGKAAAPPTVVSPQVSAGCPAAPYGTNSYAPGSGKTVALTFDDGPGASTASILSILATYGVPATFFNIGQNMAARPAPVRQEAAAGYVLGNHTWDHPDMTTLSAAAQAKEMDEASAEQVSLTGITPCAFRPPGGSYNSTTLSLAQQRKLKVWLWSVDTEDWKANGSSSPYWVNRIISLAEQEGGVLQHPVVLMHNQPAGNPATVLALPTIIRYFRDHGYTFVNLDGGTGWSSRQASQAAAQAGGVVDVLWQGADGRVYHNWLVGAWSGPALMGPNQAVGEPSVTTSSPGVVDVFWEGTGGQLWHQVYIPGGGWSAQQQMAAAGRIGGPPKAVAQADGSVNVFWRGTDGHLWELGYQPGQGWSGARNLGGQLASDPAPAATSPGTVDVFFKGTDGHLWHVYRLGGGSWSGAISLGMGVLGGPPAATGQVSGAVDVFWRGTNGSLWRAGYAPGAGWSGPANLGGRLASDPAPAATSPGTVDVFFKGTDGHLWHVYRLGGGSWTGAGSLGMGVLGSRPWVAAQPDGAIDVFWRGSGDTRLWHAAYRPGTGWTGPASLGGNLAPVS